MTFLIHNINQSYSKELIDNTTTHTSDIHVILSYQKCCIDFKYIGADINGVFL